jgi:hypothetical protein
MSSEVDPKNIIMVTLDEIPEEQRKAFEAHRKSTEERQKAEEVWELQEFLSCFKKERQGKVTQVKEVVLPTTNGTTKVIPNVSTSSPLVTPEDVSNMLHDHSKHLMEYMLEDGLVKIFKTLSISSNLPSVLASSSSAPQGEPLYGMPKNFTPSQAPPAMSMLPLQSDKSIVVSPPIVEPLDSIPSSATTGRTNELESVVPPYWTVVHSVPPIPPMETRIPRGPVPDSYFNRFAAPDRVPHVEPRRNPINSYEECLAAFREDFRKQMRDTFGVELSNKPRICQKPYPSYFDSVLYPIGWRTPDFVKFNRDDNWTTWEHVSKYLAQLGEAGSVDALKVRLFSLSLTSTAFSWFSSLLPNSISSWEQLECKFHDHFYCPKNELKLSDLTSVRQGRD